MTKRGLTILLIAVLIVGGATAAVASSVIGRGGSAPTHVMPNGRTMSGDGMHVMSDGRSMSDSAMEQGR